MKHSYEAIGVVVPGKIRKYIDSDMDTLALDEKTINRASAVPAHHHSATLYYAVVYGMRTDFVLAVPASAGDCLFERGLRITMGDSNCQRNRG